MNNISILKTENHRLSLLMLIFITANLQAQTISGIVRDEGRGKLELITVTLLKVGDSSFVKRVLTDSIGRFEMKNIPSGRYFISVYSIEHVRVNAMPFDYSGNNFSAETIILKKVVTELGAVTITSKKPLIVKRKIHHFLCCRSLFHSLFNRKNYTSR